MYTKPLSDDEAIRLVQSIIASYGEVHALVVNAIRQALEGTNYVVRPWVRIEEPGRCLWLDLAYKPDPLQPSHFVATLWRRDDDES
ncbi:MAG: hypothetical protein IT330_18630 [Anaerolineae bacterium]|nr:hypothetical protein [Anaerolineae bacterium]